MPLSVIIFEPHDESPSLSLMLSSVALYCTQNIHASLGVLKPVS